VGRASPSSPPMAPPLLELRTSVLAAFGIPPKCQLCDPKIEMDFDLPIELWIYRKSTLANKMAGMAYRTALLGFAVALLASVAVRYGGEYELFAISSKAIKIVRDLLSLMEENEGPTVQFAQLNLATIDMMNARRNKSQAALKVYKALSEVGFAYIVNIPEFEPDLLLKHTKWYFELPLEVKMHMAKRPFRQENKNIFRGYYPVIPGGHSFKEALEIGGFCEGSLEKRNFPGSERPFMRDVVQEVNVWPASGNETADTEFKEFMTKMYKVYTNVAKEVTHLMAIGLGLDEDYFDSLFGSKQLSTLRLLHYPTRLTDPDLPEEAKDGDIRITTGEHCDTSFLTILATFRNRGLQVKLSKDGQWLNIPPYNDGLIINVGALLSQMVDGKLKATNHRVIDLGNDRFSVPLFYEMRFDADVSRSLSGKVINSIYQKYGPWMTNRTSMFAEYATTDFGIAD